VAILCFDPPLSDEPGDEIEYPPFKEDGVFNEANEPLLLQEAIGEGEEGESRRAVQVCPFTKGWTDGSACHMYINGGVTHLLLR